MTKIVILFVGVMYCLAVVTNMWKLTKEPSLLREITVSIQTLVVIFSYYIANKNKFER